MEPLDTRNGALRLFCGAIGRRSNEASSAVEASQWILGIVRVLRDARHGERVK